jgi:hypothetical protein
MSLAGFVITVFVLVDIPAAPVNSPIYDYGTYVALDLHCT